MMNMFEIKKYKNALERCTLDNDVVIAPCLVQGVFCIIVYGMVAVFWGKSVLGDVLLFLIDVLLWRLILPDFG
jgi:hypothetical protein